jgi:hypothetical protein
MLIKNILKRIVGAILGWILRRLYEGITYSNRNEL